MKNGFTVPAILTGISTLRDGGLSVRFATQEIPNEQKSVILGFTNSTLGWLLFAPNEIDVSDVPDETAEDKNRTPSKRLLNVLFVYWNQIGKPGSFEAFYRTSMDKIIDHYKGKLDD